MKTLLLSALVAFAATTVTAHADDEKVAPQKIAYTEFAQTTDRDGNTALMVAAAFGETEIVRNLIARGTDVNARGYIGNTALIFAVQEGHAGIARLLVAAGANPDASNDYGSTARKLARGYGQRAMVEAFKAVPVQSSQNLVAASF